MKIIKESNSHEIQALGVKEVRTDLIEFAKQVAQQRQAYNFDNPTFEEFIRKKYNITTDVVMQIEGIDLSVLDLQGCEMGKVSCKNVNFNNVIMNDTNFAGQLENCSFDYGQIINSKLENIKNCSFKHSLMQDVTGNLDVSDISKFLGSIILHSEFMAYEEPGALKANRIIYAAQGFGAGQNGFNRFDPSELHRHVKALFDPKMNYDLMITPQNLCKLKLVLEGPNGDKELADQLKNRFPTFCKEPFLGSDMAKLSQAEKWLVEKSVELSKPTTMLANATLKSEVAQQQK